MSLTRTRIPKACLLLIAAALLSVGAGMPRAQVNLPDIGSPADAVL